MFNSLIKNKKIAVIGLGYVGLPLAVKLSKNFNVIGFDINSVRVSQLKKGIDKTKEIKKGELLDVLENKLTLVSHQQELSDSRVFIVTVPTPVTVDNKPDFRPLISACKIIGGLMKKKSIIIFESTVYPGATQDICGKYLEKYSNLKSEKDFFLGYSPERINPGDKVHTVDKITKVISSGKKEVTQLMYQIYSKINSGNIFIAKNIKVAEASKVIENSQRDINIAFINEITKICQKLNISIFDVLDASSTKWNFLSFFPGLVGGHCIGVDPFYLSTKSRELGVEPHVILSGRKINDDMSRFIAMQIDKKLRRNSRLLILGVTFKENVPDTRNSKVFDLIKSLKKVGHDIEICDPMIGINDIIDIENLKFIDLKKNSYDCVILAVSHDKFRKLYPKKINSLLKKNGFTADIKGFWRHKKHLKEYWSL